MWYAIGIFFVLILCVLMLRLRLRIELSSARRLLFFGIGRSGAEVDFVEHVTRVKLFGLTARTVRDQEKTSESESSSEHIRPTRLDRSRQHERVPSTRRITRSRVSDWLEIGSRIFRAGRKYVADLIRSVKVEKAEAQIKAGFDSPHLTGQAFGYYQALIGALPSLAPRLQFDPDWMGPSLTGSARLSLAIPLYALLGRTLVLVCRLPLLSIIRMRRNKRKGAVYANEQCR